MPIAELAVAALSKAAASAAVPILRDLLQIQDRQLSYLVMLSEAMQRLMEAPWRRSQLLIEEACQSQTNRSRYLDEARQALMEAHSLEPKSTAARAAISADLVIALGLLGQPEDARRWARRAYDDAATALPRDVASTLLRVNKKPPLTRLGSDYLTKTFPMTGLVLPHSDYLWYWNDSQIFRNVRKAMEEGIKIPQDDEEGGELLGLPPGWHSEMAARIVFGVQEGTSGKLIMTLHEEARDAEEYRLMVERLYPAERLPRRALNVDVGTPNRARISWDEP